MSENYVCPNCVKEPGDRCCQSPPEGMFCTPDTLNMTQKTPQQLKRGCERFRFIPGLDETAGSYEIGLYFQFQSVDGFPTGCEGFNWREGRRSGFSSIEGKAWEDPGCPLQTLASPASAPPTSWYMKHYAGHQEAWLTDFAAAYDVLQRVRGRQPRTGGGRAGGHGVHRPAGPGLQPVLGAGRRGGGRAGKCERRR